MANSKYFESRIVLKYALIIKEYFDLMNQSSIIKNLANPNPSLFIGMNAINRVFEFVLIKLNNIDEAYYYSQKCSDYYLEYIEQIHKSDLVQNLNHMDAVMFVYKKTIFDIYDGDYNESSSSIRNIMSLNNENLNNDQKNIHRFFNNITNFTKTLFFWNNNNITFDDRVKICDDFLHRHLHKVYSLELTRSYLEVIQQKIDMNYEKYIDLLKEILNRLETTKKIVTIKEEDRNEYFLRKFYLEQHIFYEKFNEDSTKELVKWLFV